MRPGELVDGSGVAGEGGVGMVVISGDVVDFDGAICGWEGVEQWQWMLVRIP